MKSKKIIKTLRNINKLPKQALLTHPRIRALIECEVKHANFFQGNVVQQAKQNRCERQIKRLEGKLADKMGK